METLLKILIAYAWRKKASDIHLTRQDKTVQISLRQGDGLTLLDQDIVPAGFFEYLKFISKMDLCAPNRPQSGEFNIQLQNTEIPCRFSILKACTTETGVIRLLHLGRFFHLKDLCSSSSAITLLDQISCERQGLILCCGPTGSGKSTTTHAILQHILAKQSLKAVTLEDPVEIEQPNLIQIQVSPSAGLTYEKGIEELLRHDIDIAFLGECRSSHSAKMALRASLTGHLLFTTLHCGSGAECLGRLQDLGLNLQEVRLVLKAIVVCRLIEVNHHKEAIYEIWKDQCLDFLFDQRQKAVPSLSFKDCQNETTSTRCG